MDHAVVPLDGNRHTGFGQPLGIQFAFVPQRVVLGREHHRGRQSAQIALSQRGSQRRVTVEFPGQILSPAPDHVAAGQVESAGVLAVRRRVEVEIQHWVDQQLESQRRSAALAGEQGDRGREISAGTVAAYRDPFRPQCQRFGFVRQPASRRVAVLQTGWKLVLGRQSVLDRSDGDPGARG